jgi:hypothetical protein
MNTKKVIAIILCALLCVSFVLWGASFVYAKSSAQTQFIFGVTQSKETETPIEHIHAHEPTEEPTQIMEPTEETEYIPRIEDLGNIEEQWGEAAIYVAKTIYGEARGCSAAEQEKVVWCILNRVDDPRFPDTIIGVITQPSQFHGYSSSFPVWEEHYQLALDVIARWQFEKIGGESNRNLEPDYLYFSADSTGIGNVFRKSW